MPTFAWENCVLTPHPLVFGMATEAAPARASQPLPTGGTTIAVAAPAAAPVVTPKAISPSELYLADFFVDAAATAATEPAAARKAPVTPTSPTIRNYQNRRVETQEWVDTLEIHARGQVRVPEQPSSCCKDCNARHDAAVCPLRACVTCRFADVEITAIDVVVDDGAPIITAAILSLRDCEPPNTTFQCGAVCIDCVPTADRELRDVWILTPSYPRSMTAVAAIAPNLREVAAWFRTVRERMQDLCVAGGNLFPHAVDEYIETSEFMDGFTDDDSDDGDDGDDSDDSDDGSGDCGDGPGGCGAHPHFPLPRLGGEWRACQRLLAQLYGDHPASNEDQDKDQDDDGAVDGAKETKGHDTDAEAEDNTTWVLHYADLTTATPAWQELSIQRHRVSTLRCVLAPPAARRRLRRHPPPPALNPWCYTFVDVYGSMVGRHIVVSNGAAGAEGGLAYVDDVDDVDALAAKP